MIFVLNDEGDLFAWGMDANGLIYKGINTIIKLPIKLDIIIKEKKIFIKDFQCGMSFIIIIDD